MPDATMRRAGSPPARTASSCRGRAPSDAGGALTRPRLEGDPYTQMRKPLTVRKDLG